MGAVAPRQRLTAMSYVAKPFVLEYLLRVIADVLAGSGVRREMWPRGATTWSRGSASC